MKNKGRKSFACILRIPHEIHINRNAMSVHIYVFVWSSMPVHVYIFALLCYFQIGE